MFQTFEELALKRQKWIDVNRENGFEEGIQQLLTDLYPDNAHFIYELLQNAEDSGAQVVRFTLTPDEIEFEHDGNRLFDLADVESITSIGRSNKRDDPTNIGKFGVGFKAVFAYTSSPEIHSGRFHFRIHDLVVPETVPSIIMNDKETRFLFPFNHFTKQAVKAVEEIERGLRELNDNTLLFLSHIHTIEYLFPDGSLGFLKRIEHDGGRIEIYAQQPDRSENISHWLRYQNDVEVIDEKGMLKSCRIAIAYSLADDNKCTYGLKIIPLDHGQVSIYFPAEKEPSNLRFHIHAPFASTVARDNVRDCEANRLLVNCLAELIVESLFDIRDSGLMSILVLESLPIRRNDYPENGLLFPIFSTIKQKLIQEEFLPADDGLFVSAVNGKLAEAEWLRKLLRDEKLTKLLGTEKAIKWISGEITEKGIHRDLWKYIKDELTVEEITSDSFARKINYSFLSSQSDEWFIEFYGYLSGLEALWRAPRWDRDSPGLLRVKPILRLHGGSTIEPFKSDGTTLNAYLPLLDSTDFPVVKPSIVNDEKARNFLTRLGLSEPDIFDDIVERVLPKYSNENISSISPQEHLTDIQKILRALISASDGGKKQFIQKAMQTPFLRGASDNGTFYWRKPAEVCVDVPYIETGLAELTSIHKKDVLWNGYSDQFGDLIKNFIDFLKGVGAMHYLVVEEANIHSNPKQEEWLKDSYQWAKETHTGIYEDYSIDSIESYLKVRSITVGRLIWQAVIRADRKATRAKYRPNQAYPTHEGDSQLVYHLKSFAWVPDKVGEFRRPQDMTRDELRTDFLYDDRNGLLTAIGFGEQAKKRSEDYVSQNNHAKNMGFESAEEAEKMAHVAKFLRERGQSPDKLLEQFMPTSDKKEPPFPSRPFVNPERREERLTEQISNAPDKHYEKREKSVRITNGAIDPKTWLRNQYTNDDDQMVCQICKEEMPFRKRDGKHYFEKKEVLSYLSKEHDAQYLALCPLCAAKYNEFVILDNDIMDKLQNAIISAENCEVPISLGDQDTNIRFVETHLHDLKIILNNMQTRGLI